MVGASVLTSTGLLLTLLNRYGELIQDVAGDWQRGRVYLPAEDLRHFGVTEANWRDACESRPLFALSETPAYLGRGVAALTLDPRVERFGGMTLSSGQLAFEYGLTDVDGSRPEFSRYYDAHGEDLPVDPTGYR